MILIGFDPNRLCKRFIEKEHFSIWKNPGVILKGENTFFHRTHTHSISLIYYPSTVQL